MLLITFWLTSQLRHQVQCPSSVRHQARSWSNYRYNQDQENGKVYIRLTLDQLNVLPEASSLTAIYLTAITFNYGDGWKYCWKYSRRSRPVCANVAVKYYYRWLWLGGSTYYSIQPGAPIEFSIKSDDNFYLDLDESRFIVLAKITKANGTDMDNNVRAAPVNL